MAKKNDIAHYQRHIKGQDVAALGLAFCSEFRHTYRDETLRSVLAVGPMQSYIGLAIEKGYLSLGPNALYTNNENAVDTGKKPIDTCTLCAYPGVIAFIIAGLIFALGLIFS